MIAMFGDARGDVSGLCPVSRGVGKEAVMKDAGYGRCEEVRTDGFVRTRSANRSVARSGGMT